MVSSLPSRVRGGSAPWMEASWSPLRIHFSVGATASARCEPMEGWVTTGWAVWRSCPRTAPHAATASRRPRRSQARSVTVDAAGSVRHNSSPSASSTSAVRPEATATRSSLAQAAAEDQAPDSRTT
ncbi:hypothetical protein, partial [Streptomyces sp. UG1]|uniref:hypothetical protein n=1 Tax=Streptomyces sp. UG1 TaxID=3417652 RepID=UPI003CFB4C1C